MPRSVNRSLSPHPANQLISFARRFHAGPDKAGPGREQAGTVKTATPAPSERPAPGEVSRG